MLRRLIGEDIELVTTLETALGTVNADQSQLEQVIVNLCVNARDAMPSGGKITIETRNVELDGDYARRHVGVTPGSYVLLSVADSGHGMTKEVLSRIFEPFFTTKPQGKGTGLGLSTVYGIVKQSGGNVWVYSEVGRGSTFKVYLPRVDLPREEAGAGKAPAEDDALLRGTESILLAEDDDLVRDLTTRILRKAGYRVVEASRGHQALEAAAAQKEPFDLLVTDVIMPELSGRELARALCAERPALKVLYTSGYSSDHISGELEEHPDEAFLQKPFSARTLLSAVRETIERRRPGP
jgi:CheY-like chemotaxis protein